MLPVGVVTAQTGRSATRHPEAVRAPDHPPSARPRPVFRRPPTRRTVRLKDVLLKEET
ncbi:hypothetical protein GCM10022262_28530 [Georgenia daeguensis]|uniref:Uncharacterized protein n=1 Tax=Georgenia daeguensis TaxID=908355 RepID=A0ABP8EXK8_9MICO